MRPEISEIRNIYYKGSSKPKAILFKTIPNINKFTGGIQRKQD